MLQCPAVWKKKWKIRSKLRDLQSKIRISKNSLWHDPDLKKSTSLSSLCSFTSLQCNVRAPSEHFNVVFLRHLYEFLRCLQEFLRRLQTFPSSFTKCAPTPDHGFFECLAPLYIFRYIYITDSIFSHNFLYTSPNLFLKFPSNFTEIW